MVCNDWRRRCCPFHAAVGTMRTLHENITVHLSLCQIADKAISVASVRLGHHPLHRPICSLQQQQLNKNTNRWWTPVNKIIPSGRVTQRRRTMTMKNHIKCAYYYIGCNFHVWDGDGRKTSSWATENDDASRVWEQGRNFLTFVASIYFNLTLCRENSNKITITGPFTSVLHGKFGWGDKDLPVYCIPSAVPSTSSMIITPGVGPDMKFSI